MSTEGETEAQVADTKVVESDVSTEGEMEVQFADTKVMCLPRRKRRLNLLTRK